MNQQGVRKTRSDKKVRVNPALNQKTHLKLQKLAVACNVPKTQLAADIIELALNIPEIINYLQDYHGASEYRIIPLREDGQVVF